MVAGEANIDSRAVAGPGLVGEIRIGEERPRHRHHVRVAARDDVLCELRRVDAVGGDHRDLHGFFQPPRRPGEPAARHGVRDGRDARFVPAHAGIEDIGAGGLDPAREQHDFIARQAAFDQVEHRDAVLQDEVRAAALAHATHDLDRKAHAVLDRPAPFIAALVGAQAQELRDQVAFGAHDLDPVVARLLPEQRAAREVLDGLLDFGAGEFARRDRVDRCFDRRGRDRARALAVATAVQQLQQDPAARVVHGLHDGAVAVAVLRVHHRLAVRSEAALDIGRERAGDHQRDAAARALGEERGEPPRALLHPLQPGVHRAHQDAVGERQVGDFQRREQFWIGGHGGQILSARDERCPRKNQNGAGQRAGRQRFAEKQRTP